MHGIHFTLAAFFVLQQEIYLDTYPTPFGLVLYKDWVVSRALLQFCFFVAAWESRLAAVRVLVMDRGATATKTPRHHTATRWLVRGALALDRTGIGSD